MCIRDRAGELEQPEARLDPADVVRPENGEVGVDLGDLAGDAEPGVHEPGLHLFDHRSEIEGHRVVLDLDGSLVVAGQRAYERGVDRTVRAGPDGVEGLRRDDVLGLLVHEAADRALEPVTQFPQPLREQRPVVRGHALEQGGQVEVFHDRARDPVRDGRLYVGVGGERGHGGDVAVGVAHDVRRPGGDDAQRGQDAADDDQHR